MLIPSWPPTHLQLLWLLVTQVPDTARDGAIPQVASGEGLVFWEPIGDLGRCPFLGA